MIKDTCGIADIGYSSGSVILTGLLTNSANNISQPINLRKSIKTAMRLIVIGNAETTVLTSKLCFIWTIIVSCVRRISYVILIQLIDL